MKNNTLFAIISIPLLVLFVCCKQTEAEQAEQYLVRAEMLFQQENYQEARLVLDSLHTAVPREVAYRRKADTLTWKIENIILETNMPTIDSLLFIHCSEAELLAKNFRLSKDEKYQEIGNYEHRRVRTEANTARNYLKPITDEHGSFSFTSNYIGKALNHKALNIAANGVSVDTEMAPQGNSNAYTDLGVSYETTLFTPDLAEEVITFIINHPGERLKVTLKGDREYNYTLSEEDQKAFAETYHLASVLKQCYELQQQKNNAQHRLSVVKRHLSLP